MVVSLLVALLIGAATNTGVAGEKSPADATLSDLSWIAGYWVSDEEDRTLEECWLPPSGGVMLGLHRDVFEGSDMLFEYLRIVPTADGLVYHATPRGQETTTFWLTSLTDDGGVKRAVFENPEYDFPNLIRYTLSGDDLMAEAEGFEDDQTVVEVWVWRRADFPRNSTH
jgi:hypothetical protein